MSLSLHTNSRAFKPVYLLKNLAISIHMCSTSKIPLVIFSIRLRTKASTRIESLLPYLLNLLQYTYHAAE